MQRMSMIELLLTYNSTSHVTYYVRVYIIFVIYLLSL